MNNTDIAAQKVQALEAIERIENITPKTGYMGGVLSRSTEQLRAYVEASARKLAAPERTVQAAPGFVMVPVDDPLQGAVDWFLQADGEFFCVATVQRTLRIGYNRAKRLCDLAKERAARPLTASPTAPTEASEPVGDGTLCGHCDGSGTVLAVTGHLGPDDYEYEAQCEACWGTGSSDLRDAINALSYQPHSVTPGRQMVHRADVLRIIAARTTPPPAPVLLSDETIRLANVALHEMPRPTTDWHEAAKRVCLAVIGRASREAK